MNTKTTPPQRPPIESLACANPDCNQYGQAGQGNLRVRKVYGRDEIRYLRCTTCQAEFSERKGSALWNSKVREQKAEQVAAHLGEGCSLSATTRLVQVDGSVVKRLNQRIGQHGRGFHDSRVHGLSVKALQADERHGYAENKGSACWEAEVIDPTSKFVVSHVQGQRNEQMIEAVMSDAAGRLHNRHELLLLTDGEVSYASLFPRIFGKAYQPPRHGERGRLPHIRYRIPRTLAHVQIVKRRVGSRVVSVDIRHSHGSKVCARTILAQLGYQHFNTSIIERRNATARRMNAFQVRRSLAFSHRVDTKLALGWWGVTVYNRSRSHRSLRTALPTPAGKKSSNRNPPLWPWGLLTISGLCVNSYSAKSFPNPIGDNLT